MTFVNKQLCLYNWVTAWQVIEKGISHWYLTVALMLRWQAIEKLRVVFVTRRIQRKFTHSSKNKTYHLFSFQLWRISQICSVDIVFCSGDRCDNFQRTHKYKTTCSGPFGWRNTYTPHMWKHHSDAQRKARYTRRSRWFFLGYRTNKPHEAATRTCLFSRFKNYFSQCTTV